MIQVGPETWDPLSETETREPKIKFIIQIKDYTSWYLLVQSQQ